ncbi:MAG: ATP-grasp domain-containing protein [Ginsengibacter sp.]
MRTKERFSVLIPDGESGHALNVLRCLGPMKDVRVFVLSSDPNSIIRFSKYCYKFISFTEKKNNQNRLDAIYDTVKKVKPDVILPVDVNAISLLSANRETLSKVTSVVPLPCLGEFEIANNKGLLSEWLKANLIPCPPTMLFKTDAAGFNEAVSTFSFPALLKPCMGYGGDGIESIENRDALQILLKERTISGEFVLQSFINGYDIDCSILCEDGKILAYTIQKGIIDGNIRFRRAAGIDLFHDDNTYNIVREVAEKLNWTGIAHIDLRYDAQEDKVKLIEINPRYWGSVMGSYCSGVNFPYLACLAGLKRSIIKSEIKPLRYIQGNAALKSVAKMILPRNRKEVNIEYSFKFILIDPVPTIIYFLQAQFTRLNKLAGISKK